MGCEVYTLLCSGDAHFFQSTFCGECVFSAWWCFDARRMFDSESNVRRNRTQSKMMRYDAQPRPKSGFWVQTFHWLVCVYGTIYAWSWRYWLRQQREKNSHIGACKLKRTKLMACSLRSFFSSGFATNWLRGFEVSSWTDMANVFASFKPFNKLNCDEIWFCH